MNDEPFVPTPRELSAEETEVLLHNLDEGISQRVQLPEVFRALAEDMSDSRLQGVAQRLTERLDRGDDLGAAFKSVQSAVPRHLQQALVVGAESGNLPAVLRGLSESEIARREMRRGMWSVLTYPLLVLALLTLLLIYLAEFLSPMFAEIYSDFELDLPAVTVLYVSFLQMIPWAVLILFLGAVTVVVLQMLGSRLVHWLATKSFGTTPALN